MLFRLYLGGGVFNWVKFKLMPYKERWGWLLVLHQHSFSVFGIFLGPLFWFAPTINWSNLSLREVLTN